MKIVTITLNPALDKNTYIDKLLPEKKLRCDEPVLEPGGGGINVSRALKRLGGKSLAIYLAGGPAGDKMEELLNNEEVDQQIIRVKNPTRENFIVMEKSTNHQYRFGMPGSEIREREWQRCLEVISSLPNDVEYLVASGSLPPGVPDDLYGKIAEIAREKNIKCIVDTSGKALFKAVENGVFLIKPNINELSRMAGKEEIAAMEQEKIAQNLIEEGKAEIIVVSLGARGAMVATKDKIEYVVPPTVKQQSAVGAGDSMVAGIVLALSQGMDLKDVVKMGVAAGTAATMTKGTELCRKKDVTEIFNWLSEKEQRS